VRLILEHRVYGANRRQLEALVEGFASVLPPAHFRMFSAIDMDVLICG
jgi:hypothetical protein